MRRFVALIGAAGIPAAVLVSAGIPASDAAARQPVAARHCILPASGHPLPAVVLTATLNGNKTVTFHGTTCPGALVAVFISSAAGSKTGPKTLVCDAFPDARGRFSCTSLQRYPISTTFSVEIADLFQVGLSNGAGFAVVVHHIHGGGPQTGFGGLAREVAGHRP
jgi:hypothetical protein